MEGLVGSLKTALLAALLALHPVRESKPDSLPGPRVILELFQLRLEAKTAGVFPNAPADSVICIGGRALDGLAAIQGSGNLGKWTATSAADDLTPAGHQRTLIWQHQLESGAGQRYAAAWMP
jgi:hypothetical protein